MSAHGTAAVAASLLATSLFAAQDAAVRWTPPAIASGRYESSPTFSPDGREIVYMHSDTRFDNYRLLASRCGPGGWSAPVPPSFAAPRPALEADPFFTRDGRRLFFVSSRPSPARAKGRDDLDIWVVERQVDGAWGAPERLPEPVNSEASELLPRLDGAGRLYFGSSRPGGLGQGDIYRATPGPNGAWTVENVGPPVSSPANEYEAEIAADGRTLILLADRGDRSHLYHFVLEDCRWRETRRIPARGDVFQVGPLLSPKADRLLFAQADGDRSGELFLIDLAARPDPTWPPTCPSDPPR